MKVATIIGTRPEIIRLSRVIPKLDNTCENVLIHTGQSYDYNMSRIFFEGLGVREPDYFLAVRSDTFGEQLSKILLMVEKVLLKEQPDKALILGDTNSALSAIIAKRMGIPVYHMEAGNRCFDEKVPEEVNRRIIDHSSDINMPYTERSRANLLREGVAGHKIYVTGNPIYEILNSYEDDTDILARLRVEPGRYFLVTAHRQENVDSKTRLINLLGACTQLTKEYPVIFSRHPRTAKMMKVFNIKYPSIKFHVPFGLADFIKLERNAACVLTDSGTVQEECCIFKVRCVTVRDSTERPETVECGSNIISGLNTNRILDCVRTVMSKPTDWIPPREYTMADVSDTVVNIIMGV